MIATTMTTNLTFNTKAQFKDLSYDNNTNTWTFLFTDNIYAISSGFWRLLKNKKVHAVSLDHGHQFGLPQPIDLTKTTTEELKNSTLTRIDINSNTGDLTLTLSNSLEIQIFTASSGYETLEFQVNNKRYIGLGGGENIEIVE